ncbi:flagellin [Roseibium sp. RKSG952]|uniref:flagellin n=1 Tax=Roseibium sp. RKSG952 TaxID=2529384 RepID=UPI0034CDBE84
MVIVTDNAAESLEIDIDVTDSSGSVGGVTFADFGAIDDLSGTALTAAGSGVLAANQFEVNDGETVSFDVNGTAVEITNGTGVAKSYTDQEIVDAINDALTADENDEVVAAVDATTGGITFTSSDTGATASVTVDNFSGTMTSGDALDASYLSLGDTDSDGAAKAFGSETEVSTTGSDIVVGSSSDDTINLRIESLTAEALGIDGLDISTQDGADAALDALDDAIDDVSKARAEMGAVMSRFEFRGEQIDTSIENLTAANSVLADVDIAKESAKASSYSVNVQASVSAAAQANQMPENLLQLIG